MQHSKASIPAFKTVGHGATARYERNDQIRAYINRAIDEWRYQSFDNFSMQVLVTPVEPAKKRRDYINSAGNWIGYEEYCFTAPNLDAMNLRIRMEQPGHFSIRFKGEWMSVSQYMASLTPAFDENEPVEGFSHEQMLVKRIQLQFRWWSANGKMFEFEKLAAEIRDQIYKFAIGTDSIESYPFHKDRGLRLGHLPAAIKAIRDEIPNVNLMVTSKQIYKDMSHMLFKHTTFYVDNFKVLQTLVKSPAAARIRKLHLNLRDLDYIHLFVDESRYADIDRVLYGDALNTARRLLWHMELDELTIQFEDDTRTIQLGKPVKSRLEEAWQYIRVIPIIKLVNAVSPNGRNDASDHLERMKARDSRVEEWNQRRVACNIHKGTVREYYDEYDDEEGGVPLLPRDWIYEMRDDE